MMVKFVTQNGFKVFDGFESVEWTPMVECDNPDINVVKLPYDVLKTTDFNKIYGISGSDAMAEMLLGNQDVSESSESRVSVDEMFTCPTCPGDGSTKKNLFHCIGGGQMKLFYTEMDAYILNDNGKTIERV